MFTEHVSSVYYKHHIKHRTFFLTMRFFIDVRPILNDAIFYQCLKKNVKHRANDASNDGHRPPRGGRGPYTYCT